ncbi:hypothetical protein QC762_0116830 [Podospora pseudocomata]|uniref:Uncharacterized protein n=1 Tax=Podospora pseudocomata TaxID=2093779 RepID=A0ABR0G5R4_9PEZI|nr:hypothetical protein QC762_0116830 [Podospora pseudocomata]
MSLEFLIAACSSVVTPSHLPLAATSALATHISVAAPGYRNICIVVPDLKPNKIAAGKAIKSLGR